MSFPKGRAGKARPFLVDEIRAVCQAMGMSIDQANTLFAKGDLDGAGALYQALLGDDRYLVQARFGLGLVAAARGDKATAEQHYGEVLQRMSGHAGAAVNLGVLVMERKQTQDALGYFETALRVDPSMFPALVNAGICLVRLDRPAEALSPLDRALSLQPGNPAVLLTKAEALRALGRDGEAILCFEDILAKTPHHPQALKGLISTTTRACDWDRRTRWLAVYKAINEKLLGEGRLPYEQPFENVARSMDLADNLRFAQAHAGAVSARALGKGKAFQHGPKPKRPARLKVGYLSWDWHDHPTAHLMRSFFTCHDRSRFEVFIYSYGPDDGSSYRKEIAAAADHFVDLAALDDVGAAARIHDDAIDILIDLKGPTQGARLGICALRPAPLRMTYLGFPGTSGADFFDYIITDKIVSPPQDQKFYSETFAYMPVTYQVNDAAQPISSKGLTRKDFDLPEKALVLCSFNSLFKLDPAMFDAWMGLLQALDNAVLWLLDFNEEAKVSLRARAQKLGIAPERILFAPKLIKPDHLERSALADLALDTRIYNGHTTTSDMLWAGVPVVTLKGAHFASRVSASLLAAVELPELITTSLEDYCDLVLKLGRDRTQLQTLREKLAAKRKTSALFDTARFTRDLEALLDDCWEKS